MYIELTSGISSHLTSLAGVNTTFPTISKSFLALSSGKRVEVLEESLLHARLDEVDVFAVLGGAARRGRIIQVGTILCS